MQILNNSIRIIDYANEKVYVRDTPDTFNEYISELIAHINSNQYVRSYKTTSNATEVISCILDILNNKESSGLFEVKNNIIADRLLRKEKEAQRHVGRMNINVRKGSLIQALLFDQDSETFQYLIAKVEHSEFVDDSDYSFKTGFSKDKKTIWKSCLIDLFNPAAETFDVKVYSDTKAKYWSIDFLELVELISDETNTVSSFKAIDGFLNRNIKRVSKQDYVVIRNAFISYMKSNEHIDYRTMVDTVLENYVPYDLDKERLDEYRNKLYDLPNKKGFDFQFNSIPTAINARIGKIYKVTTGIEVKITDSIPDIKETIKAFQAENGVRYLKIKVTDDDTYDSFK